MSMFPAISASAVESFIPKFWGKAHGSSGEHRWHPLAYHMADVAACALAIAEVRPWFLDWIATRLGRQHGWDQEAAGRLVGMFSYAHDLGKHATGFQMQAEHAYRACTGRPLPPDIVAARGELRHDALGLLAWIRGLPGAADIVEAILGTVPNDDVLEAWLPIASAAFGHHGTPTDHDAIGAGSRFSSVMRRGDLDGAAASCACFRTIIGIVPGCVDAAGAAAVSIPLAGLFQVADWMGSNRELLDYTAPDLPLGQYWNHARSLARRALPSLGLTPARPAPWRGVKTIVAPYAPTPMQEAASRVELPGPFLAILEDTMGSGKTEAAIALAGRAMAAGLAHGVFVGMPTTATADGQAARQAALRRLIFAEGGEPPSFTVAHGRSEARHWPTGTDGAPLPASWIADERRLRLLADLCVGTVDQALLGVMATEFAAVRRFGLLGKVLVVDEVHAYDAYTLRLIEDLLREHAALGGSTVLLSATLTADAKQRLLAAFRAGVPSDCQDFGAAAPSAPYPALTVAHAGGVKVMEVCKAPNAPPDKPVQIVHSATEVEAALLAMAAAGGCAAWVRLTVDDAITAAERLAEQHGDVTALHSRMPAMQRVQIEAGLLGRFGRGEVGKATSRAGGIVVATSVIAASLDLDFDLVVVDLRGMDEILQAFGRCRRHRRAKDGRLLPAGSVDERRAAPVLVLAPELAPVADGLWLRRFAGWGGAAIVGNAARAWRTAYLLGEAAQACYGMERTLIEAADNRNAAPTPSQLLEQDDEALERTLRRRALARDTQDSALRVSSGYVASGAPAGDDERVETRLDEVGTVEVVLVDGDSGPGPLSGSNGMWSDGRIRIPTRRFAPGGLTRAQDLARDAGLPRRSLAVALHRTGGVWVHDGEIVEQAIIDPRWGLCWRDYPTAVQ